MSSEISHIDEDDKVLIISEDGSEVSLDKFDSKFFDQELVVVNQNWDKIQNYIRENTDYKILSDIETEEFNFPIEVEHTLNLQGSIKREMMKELGKPSSLDFIPFDRVRLGETTLNTKWKIYKDGSTELVSANHNGKICD